MKPPVGETGDFVWVMQVVPRDLEKINLGRTQD
jgi:hypothetical protein